MRFLLLVVGFLIALAFFMLSPLLREMANRGRQRFYFWQLRLLAWTQGAVMAIPADIPVRNTGMNQSDVANLVAEHNKLVTKLRVLTAKLDLDATVTDTNYAALVTAADAASPALLTLSF